VLVYEPGALDEATAADLQRRGHVLKEMPAMGNVQAVGMTAQGEKVGVSDPRAEGMPAGY
jgi:gamma-glutamyltranspeptidase